MSSVAYGNVLIEFLKEIIDWCLTKVNSTSDDYIVQLINIICLIYNRNLKYIDENSTHFINHRIIELYYKPYFV